MSPLSVVTFPIRFQLSASAIAKPARPQTHSASRAKLEAGADDTRDYLAEPPCEVISPAPCSRARVPPLQGRHPGGE